MSKLSAIDLELLRGRLEFILRFDIHHDASLYLHALACIFLACDESSIGEIKMIESIFYSQCNEEECDGDDIVTRLLLTVPE